MGFLSQLFVAVVFGVKRHWHILFAILLGFGLGALYYSLEWEKNPSFSYFLPFFEVVGQIFMRLIRMLVIPLVVSSLIVGVSSLKDARQLGRLGGKVLMFFTLFMVISAVIGCGLTLLLQPGQSVQEALHQAQTLNNSSYLEVFQAAPSDPQKTLLNMIPENPIHSLAEGELVPAIFFTILFGLALAFIGPASKPLITLFESLFTATMKMTEWVMILAAPGVFALAFVTVAKIGTSIFSLLAPFIMVILAGLILQIFVVFPILLRTLAQVDFLALYQAISEAILVAFGTSSSSATLPITIANCELRAGISNRIASFVLPTGATFNKTGTTMFEVAAVLFLIQAYNIHVEPITVVMVMVFALIASVGSAGVPSSGLITMGIVFTSIGVNFTIEQFAGGVALLWAIDRILDMCRTVVNVVSSCTVATLVAASEGELKRDVLNNPDAWRQVI